jgi:hypothetical protein
MTAALALVQIILPLIPQITAGAEELWAFVNTVRSAAQQSAVWTPELEAQYQASLKATATDPAYQPDGK